MGTQDRKPFVDIPSLGRPTAEERSWRRRDVQRTQREIRAALLNARTLEQWLYQVESDDPSAGLYAIRYVGHILARHEERLVRLARAHGMSWYWIAHSMGVSRQAVHARWRKRLDIE